MTQDHNITLITGGTGSFGKTMLRGLLETDVDEIRVFSRDEEKQDALRGELSTPRVRFFIGDIRDRDSVDRAMHGVTSVFHAAALKQVPSCEFFPLEAVKTNVLGSENVIRASIAAAVSSLVSITEPTMTRFLMPLRDSVDLVRYAFENASQGDLFIKRAAAGTIEDLVEALKQIFGVPDHPVSVIGWRHAEKLYETLASAQELAQSEDQGDFLRILMDERDLNYKAYVSEGVQETAALEDYHSHNAERLDVQGVMDLLMTLPEIQAELAAWKDGR